MEDCIIYNAKDNDVIIKLFPGDTTIDEIHVQVEGEKCWIVIGYNDLLAAIQITKENYNFS